MGITAYPAFACPPEEITYIPPQIVSIPKIIVSIFATFNSTSPSLNMDNSNGITFLSYRYHQTQS